MSNKCTEIMETIRQQDAVDHADLMILVDEIERLRGVVEKYPAIIDAALSDYRCQNTHDENGDGMLLCDVFSDSLASSVHYGLEELVLLGDYISGEICAAAAATQPLEGEG